MTLVVKPSRSLPPTEKPTATLSPSGPDAVPVTSYEPKLPIGTVTPPLQPLSDGRSVTTLTRPPSVLRPNSALCGPRTNSTRSTLSRPMLDVLVLSCGTPSMYVVTPGLAG